MRKDNCRGKKGTLMKCPKDGYKWRVKDPRKPYICCPRCKRYFKPSDGMRRLKKR